MGTAKTEVMEADIGNSIYRFWYNTVGDFGNEARRLITTSSSFNKDITDKHNETEQKENDDIDQEADVEDLESDDIDQDDDVENLENDVLERTKERILQHKIFPRVKVSGAMALSEILLNKAAELISLMDTNANQLVFIKLCLSKTINLLNHDHVEIYRQILSDTLYNDIVDSARAAKSILKPTENQFITNLFAKLLEFQFDCDCKRVTILLDDMKSAEKDKESDNYKVLRIVSSLVENFKIWKREEDSQLSLSEMTYVRKLANLLDILLEDDDVDIYDGELISEVSQHMGILRGEQDYGRKIDIMAKSRYNNVRLELCSIEFKVQGADDTTFMRQQSKNIRTNICILNEINNITKKSKSILHMDWKGRKDYLVLLHQHNDIVICQYVDTLYIPKKLI